MTLLIKYWKSPPESKSKKEIKKLAINKCVMYVPHFKDSQVKRAPEINKMVERVWKDWKIDGDNPSKLRTINSIGFSKEVLNWFLNLEETCVIDDEKKLKMQEMRSPARISNHPMTFTRTRFLFTLFVWACIQSNYANGLYHNIDKSIKKLRLDGDLPTSFNVLNERNILEDLGFIRTTDKNVDLLLDFIEKEPVFSIPVTKDNEIKLEGLDLYDCGKWLEKQKYGSFTCQYCGEEIVHYSNKPNEKRRKYCNKCATILKSHNLRKKYCIDCGEELLELTNGRRRIRCALCQDAFRKNKEAERQSNIRKYANKAISPISEKS